MNFHGLAVYCADIGSVAKNRFGWAGIDVGDESSLKVGSGMRELVDAVAHDLNAGRPVSLGFECPLFVPITTEPSGLTCARPGEGSRPWSAGAGAGALATGLSQTVWLLRAISQQIDAQISATLDWTTFTATRSGLFLWEAFVTGNATSLSHSGDAVVAIRSFISALPRPDAASAVRCDDVHSLIGAAMIRTGWSTDTNMLSSMCVVIKAELPVKAI